MSRITTLKGVVLTRRGILTASLTSLLFLIFTYYINGAPESVFYLSNYASPYVVLQRSLTVLLAILVGITTTIMIHRVRVAGLTKEEGATTSLAGVISIIGTGCAGCVAGVMPGLLATLGIGINFLAMPLLGAEFLIIGILILSISLYWMLTPMTCPLKTKNTTP